MTYSGLLLFGAHSASQVFREIVFTDNYQGIQSVVSGTQATTYIKRINRKRGKSGGSLAISNL